MRKASLATAALSAVLALLYLWEARRYSWGSVAQPGPGLYPALVGVLVLVASLGIGIEAASRRSGRLVDWSVGPALRRLATILGPTAGCVVLLPYLGHPVAGTLLTLAVLRLTGGSFWKSLLSLSIGLALATVGMDLTSGATRYTFDIVALSQGIDLVPVVMGLFGVGEVLAVAERAGGLPRVTTFRFRELFPSREEWKRSVPAILRGTGLGFLIGLLPGPSGVISSFASYALERRVAKRPGEFGHGAIEGVAGPESANNAASSAAMVPLLALGIPFSPITAMLLAALLIQGVQPGPLLMQQRPEIFWGVVASMFGGMLVLVAILVVPPLVRHVGRRRRSAAPLDT